MHSEILSNKQAELLPLVKSFSTHFYLVGGTAIGLQIGHRQSIDFDLFSNKLIKPNGIKNQLKNKNITYEIIHQEYDQLHLSIDEVKFTFFTFPYKIKAINSYKDIIKMPSLLDLTAMKALALGGRAKWKDYVDMYFLLKYSFSLLDIELKAEGLFGEAFSAKLFRQQLAYFKDIDYSEEVSYMNEEPTKPEIEKFLIEAATTEF
ncbi:MAG: nucleotidyl transferase AbiEii/AbiGii toxin family protein [Bacteroidota bacterium]|nr:nucleotidyl transferase AbiEii/AbiGii toxin family protein [Bacteroidota bacterium]